MPYTELFRRSMYHCIMDFRALPKVELHLHLDCSLSFDVVHQLDPNVSRDEYLNDFVAGGKCHNLNDYLQKAIKGIELMQSETQLIAVTEDLFDQLKRDGVLYAEIRFAPLQHLCNGLSAEQVVDIVDRSIVESSRRTGIEARMILCTLRHFSEEESMQTVRLIDRFAHSTAVGLDIAADEAGFPLDHHISAFEYARKRGYGVTAHAGEACGPESVWETLEHLKPSRIGHGVRSAEDENLMKFLRDFNIHLEICPTSNIQTNVYQKLSDHRIDTIFRAGVSCGVNTDGRTISDISLSEEYANLHENFNWGSPEFLKCNLNALAAAFAPDQLKERISKRLKAAYT